MGLSKVHNFGYSNIFLHLATVWKFMAQEIMTVGVRRSVFFFWEIPLKKNIFSSNRTLRWPVTWFLGANQKRGGHNATPINNFSIMKTTPNIKHPLILIIWFLDFKEKRPFQPWRSCWRCTSPWSWWRWRWWKPSTRSWSTGCRTSVRMIHFLRIPSLASPTLTPGTLPIPAGNYSIIYS